MATAVEASNHTSSALVNHLHDLPHYNFGFSRVSPDFDYQSQDYLESLAQFAIPWVLVALLSVLAWKCFGKGDPEYNPLDEDDARLRKWTTRLVVFAAIVILLSPLYYFGNEEIATGVAQFRERLKGSQTVFNGIMQSADECQDDISEVITDLPAGGDNLDDLTDSLTAANQSLTTVLEFRNSMSNVDNLVDEIAAIERIRWISMLAFAALLVLTALMAIRGRWGCSQGGRSKFCACGSIMAVISFILGGIFFAASIAASDFCTDPNRVITQILEGSNSDTLAEAAAYYINCPSNTNSPFFNQLEGALGDFEYSIALVKNLTDSNPSYNETLYNLYELNTSADALLQSSDCVALHQEYVGALDAVCGNGVMGFMMVTVVLAVSAMALIVCVAAVRTIKKLFLDDEVSPLTPKKGGKRKHRRGEFDPLVRETYFGPP